jgi:hypothetical protein
VKVCQAFASSLEGGDMASLERNGFDRVTQLVYLRRDVDIEAGWGNTQPNSIKCRPMTGVPTEEQIEALLATHEATLDCPELNGLRTPEEIVGSYFPVTQPNCSWWLTDGEEDKPVGVILFDRGPEPSVLELSYLGLIPSMRGQGRYGRGVES